MSNLTREQTPEKVDHIDNVQSIDNIGNVQNKITYTLNFTRILVF
jgi:hypothetical protein